ncbi:hypothetical protein GCM10010517_79790 [Streptosporangium fragile]|uniref:Uncharacterized protein n=1 Tax=Streptosporangium fragile TaxID=46186 RepID=A0ABN3WG48_9ACTN
MSRTTATRPTTASPPGDRVRPASRPAGGPRTVRADGTVRVSGVRRPSHPRLSAAGKVPVAAAREAVGEDVGTGRTTACSSAVVAGPVTGEAG